MMLMMVVMMMMLMMVVVMMMTYFIVRKCELKMLSDLDTFLAGVVVLNLSNFIFLPFHSYFYLCCDPGNGIPSENTHLSFFYLEPLRLQLTNLLPI